MTIYQPGTSRDADEQLIGAKARNLSILIGAGHAVPPFFVVTADAFASAATASPGARSIPAPLLREIEDAAAERWTDQTYLAVRSSAVGEDSADLSYAGQLVSFLFVRRSDLAECILGVWQSAFSERVSAYRKHNGVHGEFPRVAVIIQEMIAADISGVAFGIDPVSGDRSAVVISAVYGLGEGLVSGELDADTYLVRRGGTVESNIAQKHHQVVFDRHGGRFTTTESLPAELCTSPTLTPTWIEEIAAATRRLGTLFGRPQDVEWCIAENRLYLLQSRPVTGLASSPDTTRGRILWDNSNIIESYSGVTTPLTFSFVRDVYSEVYQELCRILGVDQETIDSNRDIFEMLGLIRGRIYYNLLNWYRLLVLLPGYSINAGFMEQMMGVKDRLEETPTVVPSKRNPYIRLGFSLYRLVANLVTLPKNIIGFQKHLNTTLAPLEKNDDLRELAPDELMALYGRLERSLLQRWRLPILNDFYTMIFFGLLKRTIEKWQLDSAGTLHNDLLSGEGGIISTEPMRRLREIGARIGAEPELAALFQSATPGQALRALREYPELHREVEEYVEYFGDRYVGELKLETITPKQNRELIVKLLAGYLHHGSAGGRIDPEQLRRDAEATVQRKIRSPFRRWLFNWLLRQARERVKNRENLRFERTRVFGVVRRIFLAIGERFSAEGVLAAPRDIFWLTKEEIFDFIIGAAATTDLRGLADIRRAEFARYGSQPPADRFATYGVVYLGNAFREEGQATIATEGADLSGTPCCPGIVRKRVRVVLDPGTAPPLDGDIMVAERTDPGWAPLFPMAGGLLVERGSLLSHSAIVARELGIPAIVGITGLITRLRDGDLVEMDGARGTIRIITGEEDQ